MNQYKNFTEAYQNAITEELRNTAISESKRKLLMTYRHSPTINLNVLSYQSRQRLRQMFRDDILKIDQLVKQFGTPGFLYPSENTYSLAGRMITDQSSGRHPFISLIEQLSFGIDTAKTGTRAVDVGYSALPTYEALESAYKQGPSLAEAMDLARRENRAVKLFIYDTEMSGFGTFANVRNLGAVSSTVDEFGNFTKATPIISYHMKAKEMAEMTVFERSGAFPTQSFADFAFGQEKLSDREATSFLGRLDELYDLSTQEGRRKTANAYKDFFEKALQHDYIVGHNISFDVQKVLLSAGMLDEFVSDQSSLNLMMQFAQMVKSGKVINTLDMLRENQMAQALKEARAAGFSGAEADKFAQKIVSTIYGPKAMGKMLVGNVSPASIENAILSSNLLELINDVDPELIAKLGRRNNSPVTN